MSEYKNIKGLNIKSVSSDPSNPIEGQIWYNTTEQKIKGNINTNGLFAVSSNMNNPRDEQAAQAGDRDSAIIVGGGPHNASESYNGTSWTAANNPVTSIFRSYGIGTSTLALACGNNNRDNTVESWNGTCWAAGTAFNTGRDEMGSVGIQTSGLIFGGNLGLNPESYNGTESWNGAAWTAVNNLVSSQSYGGSAGSSTSALWFGGFLETAPGSQTTLTTTQSWDGTCWTTVNPLLNAKQQLVGWGTDNTSAYATAGANPAPVSRITERWNGTSWTTIADFPDQGDYYRNKSADGSSASALITGGGYPFSGTTPTSTVEFLSGPYSGSLQTSF